jgi:hypothetical protein
MMTLIFILMEKPDYITQSMYEDAIASDKSGSERIADLSLLTWGNEFSINILQNTFEIDLALSGSKKYFLRK